MVVRNALVKAIAAGLDVAFIDPGNNGAPNVKPASITYGADTEGSTGDAADDIRLDVRAPDQKFIDANNASSQAIGRAVWRERVWHYVYSSVVAVLLKKKQLQIKN